MLISKYLNKSNILSSNKNKNLKLIYTNVIVFITLFCLLEIVLFISRKIIDKPSVGLFVSERNFNEDGCHDFISHPFYGHTHTNNDSCNIRGGFMNGPFVYYDDYDENFSSILVLGGSTTDGVFQKISDGYTWPYFLNKLIKENGLKYNVINGGVGGYNSQKEFLKLLIDGRKLKNIKLVISVNGINELENYNNIPEDIKLKFPFYSDKIFDMFYSERYIDQRNYSGYNFFPNIQSLVKFFVGTIESKNRDKGDNVFFKSINDSNFKDFNSIDNWEFSIESMKLISNLIGSKYYCFIQPTMGLNDCQIPTNEKSSDYKIYKSQITSDYLTKINSLYKSLKNIGNKLEYCYDLSCVAGPSGNNYSDIRHHNKNGNLIIAKEIFSIIRINL